MNTTTAPRMSHARPLYIRVAIKWYSWAGLALTLTASYLAFDGQLKFGAAGQLQAAPPTAEVSWKSSQSTTASGPALPVSGEQGPSLQGPTLQGPDVFTIAQTQPKLPSNVNSVLTNYASGGKNVTQAQFQNPPVEDPNVAIPAIPDQTPMPMDPKAMPRLEEAPAAADSTAMPPGPNLGGFPEPGTKPDPTRPPAVPDVKLPPVQPRKTDMPIGVPAVPAARQPAAPVKQPAVAVKQPAVETAQPGGVEGKALDATVMNQSQQLPAPKKEEALAAPIAKEVDSLSQDERILYNAAQNAVQLKNYPVAIERYEMLFRRRPDLVHIREEYAGILSRAGDFRRTIAIYQEIINHAIQQRVKGEAIANFRALLGDAYVSAKEYRQAILQYAEAVRMVPNAPEYSVRLARAYVFYNDQLRATQVYDRYLATIRPDDPLAPAALGVLLLDLERPADALPFLLAKKKYFEGKLSGEIKDNYRSVTSAEYLEVLTGLVRAYARLADRQSAMEIITEMLGKSPDNATARLLLADILLSIEEFELAGQVYNQVLLNDPANGGALIGMARVHVEMYQPVNARKILDSFIPNLANQRNYLLAYAAYHQLVGEYIEAKQIYLDMLRRNPADYDVHYALGRLYEFIREFEKAKAEFAKIPPIGAAGRQARIWFSETLASQRKFAEAAEVARVLIQDDPFDSAGIAAVTRHLTKAKQFDAAIANARGYLATNPRSEQQAVGVRLALARALLDSGRTLDAAKEYEIALSRPSGRVVLAYYGLARASAKLGNTDRAAQLLGYVNGLPGGDVRNRMQLADLFASDFDDNKAQEMCMVGRFGEGGDNLAVLIRLADIQQRLSRFTGNPQDCFGTTQQILHISPTNVRGHLALARAFAIAQNYRKSSAQYDQLILIDPDFTIPPRERARVLYSDRQYSASHSQYSAMLQQSADDQILTDISTLIVREPKLRPALNPYVVGRITGVALRGELQRLAGSADEEVRVAAQRLVADYDATVAWQRAYELEAQAKDFKGLYNYEAIPAYQSLIEYEKTNTEALFDLGQTFGTLNYTTRALDMYGQLLQVDEQNRDAMVASERAQANMGPKLNANFYEYSQRGRQGLTNIDRYRYSTSAVLPLGDENEYLELGYTRAVYVPSAQYNTDIGNIPWIHAQKRFCDDRFLAYGTVGVEQWTHGFTTRPVFDIGGEYYISSLAKVHAGGFLENVAENGESIAQNIYRYGGYIGGDVQATRMWRFGGEYRYAHYSDVNNMSQLYVYNDVSLTLPPKQFKIVEDFLLQGFTQQTVFPTNPPNPNDLFGAIHPYFAPKTFALGQVRAEWWEWLSRDYFVHSNQCYYTLQAGIATDNNMNTYGNFRALFNYDVCTWLSVGAQGSAIVSHVYQQYTALAYLQIRFR